jgi:heme/copper-type cytochrome/quinol oxidase subunit 3
MEKNKMAMILFIGSESVFFLALILSYLYLNEQSFAGPTAKSSLDPLRTGLVSIFLFLSSFTMWQVTRNLDRGKHRLMKIWLLGTILLGIGFLVGQGIEWSQLIVDGTIISTNVFSTTFFTLTGFHGTHVLIGLVMLTIVLGLAIAGNYQGTKSAGITSVSLYWHFVDAVWVVIYSVVYIRALFLP